MTHAIRTGTTGQIAFFRAYDTDGTAKTDLTASTTGLTLSVFRVGLAATSIASLTNKAADNTAHSAGAIRNVQGNLYTVDLPDAAVASQCPSICVKGTYTGGVIEGVPHPIVGYDGTADAVGAVKPTTAGRTLTVDTSGQVTVGGYATGQAPLQPTVAGRTLAVDASGIVTDTAGTTTLLSRLTSTRAGLLDNLDVAISTIQSQIAALNNLSAKANWFGSALLEIPDSGSRAYVFELVIKDDEDKLVNLDALPTITLTNSAGTDRSALITTGIANAATGRYTLTITVGTSTTNEALLLKATGTVSGETRYAVLATQVVDYDSGSIINSIYTTLGVPATSTIAGDIAASKAVVDSVSGRIPSALVGGRMDVSVGAMASAVITAASIASGALNGKGDWRTALTLLGSLTETQWANLVAAALLGQTSQPSGTTEKFKHLDGSDAFTTTLDSNGNRTNVAIA